MRTAQVEVPAFTPRPDRSAAGATSQVQLASTETSGRHDDHNTFYRTFVRKKRAATRTPVSAISGNAATIPTWVAA